MYQKTTSMSWSIWAAVTYQSLGSLQTTEICFSQFWRLGSPGSRRQHGHILVRAFFLVHSQCLLAVSPHGGRDEGSLWSLDRHFGRGFSSPPTAPACASVGGLDLVWEPDIPQVSSITSQYRLLWAASSCPHSS